MLLVLLLIGSSLGAPTFSFLSQEPFVVHHELRLLMEGAFSDGWALRLARNSSNCDSGMVYDGGLAANNIPNATMSNVVRWTINDNPTNWTASFQPSRVTENGVVCWSSDAGVSWSLALTKQHQSLFRVWKTAPSAITAPQTVTAGQLFRVIVLQPLSHSSRAVLVANESSCSGTTPRAPVTETARLSGEGFEFRSPRHLAHAFLCVSLNFHAPWSVIPFQSVVSAAPNVDQTSRSMTIYHSSVRFRKATVECTTAIAGVRTYCTIEVRNTTLIPISVATVQISLLTDGGHVRECPTPPLEVVSSTKLAFSFTPQRSGNDGTVALRFLNDPLLIEADNVTNEYFARKMSAVVRNISSIRRVHVVPWFTQDLAVKKITVHPAFSYLQHYEPTNLLDVLLFNYSSDWTSQLGIQRFTGRLNLTVNDEMTAVTLNASTRETIVQEVSVPALAERCRLRLQYYLLAGDTALEDRVFVGSVKLSSSSQSVEFSLFSYQRHVLVLGSHTRGEIVGDVFSLEQLAAEIPITPTSTSLTLSLTIDHTQAGQLYFAGPELLCAVTNTAKTNLQDTRALQRLFDAVGGSSTLSNWKVNGAFNGDPCTNQWQGVECRHMRVVSLRLRGTALSGSLPHLRELTMLETIDVSRNDLTGGLPFNNSRVTEIDVSFNRLSTLAMPQGAFGFATHHCVHLLRATNNQIQEFPSLSYLPQLRALELTENEMRSSLPDFSHVAPALEVLHLSTNHLVGTLPEMPQSIVSVDLSANRLEGTLPLSWQLKAVKFLDVSKNLLNGTIPWSIAEIPKGRLDVVFRAEDNFLVGLVPRLAFKLVDLRHNFFECPLMRPEIDTNTSEMNVIVNWGVNNWCDYNSADPTVV